MKNTNENLREIYTTKYLEFKNEIVIEFYNQNGKIQESVVDYVDLSINKKNEYDEIEKNLWNYEFDIDKNWFQKIKKSKIQLKVEIEIAERTQKDTWNYFETARRQMKEAKDEWELLNDQIYALKKEYNKNNEK